MLKTGSREEFHSIIYIILLHLHPTHTPSALPPTFQSSPRLLNVKGSFKRGFHCAIIITLVRVCIVPLWTERCRGYTRRSTERPRGRNSPGISRYLPPAYHALTRGAAWVPARPSRRHQTAVEPAGSRGHCRGPRGLAL